MRRSSVSSLLSRWSRAIYNTQLGRRWAFRDTNTERAPRKRQYTVHYSRIWRMHTVSICISFARIPIYRYVDGIQQKYPIHIGTAGILSCRGEQPAAGQSEHTGHRPRSRTCPEDTLAPQTIHIDYNPLDILKQLLSVYCHINYRCDANPGIWQFQLLVLH